MILIYNILFPLIFILFLPGMIIKLIRRPGYKSTFAERFALFSAEKKAALRDAQGAIWIHSVSVGETVIALSMISKWSEKDPNKKFILSTTTTTGQQLAQDKAPENVTVIFCPIDWIFFVRRALSLVQPSLLVIFETEIWPNLITQGHKSGAKLAMVNARMSDNSIKGYTRFKSVIGPLLEKLDLICVQSQMDGERFASISPNLSIEVPGNMKFDQSIPAELPDANLTHYFGEGERTVILAASTHQGEEKFIAEEFLKLKQSKDSVRLIIVPRHAERGNEIVEELQSVGVSFARKTNPADTDTDVDCLLADTTGEMLMFINAADIVIMGKSMAGHDEGHNLIEPALMAKPIVTGSVLKNFRFVLNVLKSKEALLTIDNDDELLPTLERLVMTDELRSSLGQKAQNAILEHRGAVDKSITKLGEIL